MQRVQTLADIRRLIDAGATITGAIKEAIAQTGQSLGAFALAHGVSASHLSKAINGTEAPTGKLLSVMISVFGGTEIDWRVLFHQAGAPVIAAVAS